MKLKHKILWAALVIVGLCGMVYTARPTGVTPNNSVQSGTIVYSGTNQSATVTFPVAYTQIPVIQFTPSITNATPLTNSAISTTNFTLVVASTNLSVNYTAFIGYPRVQTGTNTVTGGTLLTNVFAVPFAYTPIINVEGSNTNVAGVVAVQSLTTTQVVFQSSTTQLIYWGAFGVCATPGIMPVTY